MDHLKVQFIQNTVFGLQVLSSPLQNTQVWSQSYIQTIITIFPQIALRDFIFLNWGSERASAWGRAKYIFSPFDE